MTDDRGGEYPRTSGRHIQDAKLAPEPLRSPAVNTDPARRSVSFTAR